MVEPQLGLAQRSAQLATRLLGMLLILPALALLAGFWLGPAVWMSLKLLWHPEQTGMLVALPIMLFQGWVYQRSARLVRPSLARVGLVASRPSWGTWRGEVVNHFLTMLLVGGSLLLLGIPLLLVELIIAFPRQVAVFVLYALIGGQVWIWRQIPDQKASFGEHTEQGKQSGASR